MKLFITVITLMALTALPAKSAQSANDQAIMAPINNLFDAMRAHDGDKILSQFTATAHLQRAGKDNQVKSSSLAKFATSIGKATKYLDEQLFNVTILQSGNLASVWTPFAFYVDKKLSHCGVNSFQLVKGADGWKIHYLIDNGYQGDCNGFIKQHKG